MTNFIGTVELIKGDDQMTTKTIKISGKAYTSIYRRDLTNTAHNLQYGIVDWSDCTREKEYTTPIESAVAFYKKYNALLKEGYTVIRDTVQQH